METKTIKETTIFLIDSKGGAGSEFQLDVLKTHLENAIPKYIV